MSARYHINDEGNVGKCSAAKGQCPFGDSDAHFDRKEQAEHAAEERLTAQYGTTATVKKEKPINIEGLTVEEREKLAEDENTPAETLAELAGDEDREVRYAVAGNPNTPPEVLAELVEDEDWDVRAAVAENPSTPVETLVRLTEDEDLRDVVALNPSMPPEILSRLSEDGDYNVRRRVALNKSTTPDVLTKLSRDTNNEVREAVAENENTPLSVSVRLASDQDSSAAKTARETISSKLPWSDNDKEIALGLLDETRGKESGSYFPSLEALQEAVEAYKKIGATENFDPNNGEGLTAAFVWAEPVKRD